MRKDKPRISEADLEDWLLDLIQVTHWHSVHIRPAMRRDGTWISPVAGEGKGYPVELEDKFVGFEKFQEKCKEG